MGNKCDERIYGIDETSYAKRVSSQGLDTSDAKEDVWGSTYEQGQRSKGNSIALESDGDYDAHSKNSNGNDGDKSNSKGN